MPELEPLPTPAQNAETVRPDKLERTQAVLMLCYDNLAHADPGEDLCFACYIQSLIDDVLIMLDDAARNDGSISSGEAASG